VKHKELLNQIASINDSCSVVDTLATALSAVVRLHKPQQRCYDATCYCVDMCSKCKEDYPCSDIQAIEKALV
jgi:hypothetical protein